MTEEPMKKYELTKNTKNGLYQIRALRDFGNTKAGELGGWVYSEYNLSHKGNCWVRGDAWVSDTARVFGDAQVFGDAWVYGNAQVFGNARVFGNAQISGNVRFVEGRAFATKTNSWDITEVDNNDGTTTLYAFAVFEPTNPESCHEGQTGKFCSECGEKL